MGTAVRRNLAVILGIATVGALLVMVGFRFAVYGHMYIGPDDPHGLSDVIDFLLGCLLIGLLGASALCAVVLLVKGPREKRAAAVRLLALSAAILALAEPLHTLAAKWAL